MKYILAVLLTIHMACACAQQYMGHTVTNMPFPIARGKTVSLPVTDAGPIPAENEKIGYADFVVEITDLAFRNRSAKFVESDE